MAKDRRLDRHKQDGASRMRAVRNDAAAIDAQLAEARTKIDWKRRRRAEKSLET